MARTVKAPEVRRDEIVAAARELFALQGINATTFQDIADRVGVTRGLVYHYAGSMSGLVDQVLAACVTDFARDLRAWDAQRVTGDIDGAITAYVRLLRDHLPNRATDTATDRDDSAPASARPVPRIDDAGLYVRYIDASVEAVVRVLEESTIPAYAARHDIAIDHVRETFELMLHGLIGVLRNRPDIGDDVLADLVRQTLRLAPNDPGA